MSKPAFWLCMFICSPNKLHVLQL